MKTYQEILDDITQEQIQEAEYKGTLNRDLYLIMYDTLGKVSQKIFWKGKSVKILNDFTINALDTDVVISFGVTNGYDDWYINILTK